MQAFDVIGIAADIRENTPVVISIKPVMISVTQSLPILKKDKGYAIIPDIKGIIFHTVSIFTATVKNITTEHMFIKDVTEFFSELPNAFGKLFDFEISMAFADFSADIFPPKNLNIIPPVIAASMCDM